VVLAQITGGSTRRCAGLTFVHAQVGDRVDGFGGEEFRRFQAVSAATVLQSLSGVWNSMPYLFDFGVRRVLPFDNGWGQIASRRKRSPNASNFG
jgi:hypothetical protein